MEPNWTLRSAEAGAGLSWGRSFSCLTGIGIPFFGYLSSRGDRSIGPVLEGGLKAKANRLHHGFIARKVGSFHEPSHESSFPKPPETDSFRAVIFMTADQQENARSVQKQDPAQGFHSIDSKGEYWRWAVCISRAWPGAFTSAFPARSFCVTI